MGIPFFGSWIRKNYPSVFYKTLDIKKVDIFCLDFNGCIYNSVNKVLKNINTDNIDETFLQKEIINDVIKQTQIIINDINPSTTFIAIDGTCSRLKMIQQRYRRYMSNLIKEKNGINEFFDTNCITPGTIFMKRLNEELKKYFLENKSVIISDSDERGEGEHKIITFLSNFKNKNIVVSGLDADLIILTFEISKKNNLYILRDTENGRNFIYGHMLISQLTEDIPIKDLILVFSFLGNDFLPEIKTVNYNGSMRCEKIFIAYKNWKKYNKTQLLIKQDNSLNIYNLINFFSFLKKDEETSFSEGEINSYYCYYKIFDKKDFVEKYLQTLSWIMYFYLDNNLGCPGWRYFYPYKISPFIKDIIFYGKDIKNYYWLKKDYWYKDSPCSSECQLLYVLPNSSLNLIPNPFLKEIAKTILKHFYPKKFNIDIMDSDKPHWMQKLFLPDLDYEYIEEIVKLFI